MQPKLGWEICLDCQISPIIAKWLREETGYIVKSSYILNLQGLDDDVIYRLAKANETKVIFISKDSDLPDLVQRFGAPPKLIYIKFGNTESRVLFNLIMQNLQSAMRRLITDNVNIVDME